MATYTIPLPTGLQSFTQQVELENKVYDLLFKYNAREAHWYMTISRNDVILLSELKLVHGADLLSQFKYIEEMPKGKLAIVDLNSLFTDPDAETLGQSVVMRYTDAI